MWSRSRNRTARMLAALGQRPNLHYLCTALAFLALLPALRLTRLPMRWDWGTIVADYAVVAVQSSVAALLLHAVQFPEGALSFLRSFPRDRPKLLLTVSYLAILLSLTTLARTALAFLLVVAIMGLRHEPRTRQLSRRPILPLLASTGYLFLGLLIVFSFVNVIVRIRFYGLYSPMFGDLDRSLIGPSLALLTVRLAQLKTVLYPALDFVYYGMFAQIGAGLLICALCSGSRASLQLAGTILFAYYIALVLFFFLPSIGPFLHPGHFGEALHRLPSYHTQRLLLANAQYLWEQRPVEVIPTAYYIGFPCMHIAQPVIVLSYLRRWKRMAALLLAYDVLLVAAILILEWHYFVDVIGGVMVAMAALAVIGNGGNGGAEGVAVAQK